MITIAHSPSDGQRNRRTVAMVGFCALVIVALILGLSIGVARLPFDSVVATLWHGITRTRVHGALRGSDATVFWQIRFPRVVLAALVGSALSIAGASYQGVFQNPLADPYLLGAASGAGLGATLVLSRAGSITGWAVNPLPVAAFIGALIAVALSLGMATAVGSGAASGGTGASSAAILLLAGVAVASFLTAVQTFVQQQRSDTLRIVYAWIMGGLTTSGWGEVRLIAPYLLVSSVVLIALARRVDVMAVGDEEARMLGVSPSNVRLVVVVAASLATAAAVAVSGLIGFVGLIIPHAVRGLIGHGHRHVLFGSALVGAAFLVLADTVARTIISPAELPLGVITAFVGAPIFARLLVRQHRRQS